VGHTRECLNDMMERTTSRSLMLSAPTHMPAITVVSFGDGLADPDLILGAGMQILSANNCDNPDWAATSSPGPTRARHKIVLIKDRRRGGKAVRHLHRKCLFELGRLLRKEHQSSQLKGHFPYIDTLNPASSSVDRG
jgi:hypothetical protein